VSFIFECQTQKFLLLGCQDSSAIILFKSNPYVTCQVTVLTKLGR